MELIYSEHSPFARKVRVFAIEAGLIDNITLRIAETSPTQRNDSVYKQNPLGKVPVLILDDQTAIYDSAVICDYLDNCHHHPAFIPAQNPQRHQALRLQALANGLCEAGIALRWEIERRPQTYRYPAMADAQKMKLHEGLDWLESNIADLKTGFHIGHIALATALDWIDFRSLVNIGPNHPAVALWLQTVKQRPSMRSTGYLGHTQD